MDNLAGKVVEKSSETGEIIFEGIIDKGKKQGPCFFSCETYFYEGEYENDQMTGPGKISLKPHPLTFKG